MTTPSLASRVYNSATESIANTTFTPITFASEKYDTDALHSTSSNTSRFTIPVPGLYGVGGNFGFQANTAGTVRAIGIRVNGTLYIAYDQRFPVTTAAVAPYLEIETEYLFSASDYVELIAYQDCGGPLNVLQSSEFSPIFWISRRV